MNDKIWFLILGLSEDRLRGLEEETKLKGYKIE